MSYVVVGVLERNEVIGVVEDGFLHRSGWSGVLEEFVKRVVRSDCVVSEV